nr:uncharacterized protein LOC122322325 [Drosophila bipectinata]
MWSAMAARLRLGLRLLAREMENDDGDRNKKRKCSKPAPVEGVAALLVSGPLISVFCFFVFVSAFAFCCGFWLCLCFCVYAGSNNQVSSIIINMDGSSCSGSSNVIIGPPGSLLTWPIARTVAQSLMQTKGTYSLAVWLSRRQNAAEDSEIVLIVLGLSRQRSLLLFTVIPL